MYSQAQMYKGAELKLIFVFLVQEYWWHVSFITILYSIVSSLSLLNL